MHSANFAEYADRYDLLRRVMDDEEIRSVFGGYPSLEKRVRRSYQRYFLEWLRDYEREVWSLNSTRIRMHMADGRWLDAGLAFRRACDYGRLCLRLRWAAALRRLRMGSPVKIVETCIGELQRLDSYRILSETPTTAFPSA